jgi:hypothetical protein
MSVEASMSTKTVTFQDDPDGPYLQFKDHNNNVIDIYVSEGPCDQIRRIVRDWDFEDEAAARTDVDLTETRDIAGFADRHDALTCSLCSTPSNVGYASDDPIW